MNNEETKYPALRVKNLSKVFKGKTALEDISFSAEKGEILGIIGANGAGKTTLLKCLLSVLKPNSGDIFYFNKDLKKNRSKILQKVGFASTYTSLPFFLTVRENLEFSSRLFIGSFNSSKALELLKMLGGEELYNRKFSSLSAGEKTKVMIVRAYIHSPEVVFLDEPTASLDFETAGAVRRFIHEERTLNNTTVLLTSHNLSEVDKLTDRLIVIQKGKLISSGSTKELFGDERRYRVKVKLDKVLDNLKFKTMDDGSIEMDLSKEDLGILFKEYGSHITGQIDITESPIEDLVRDILHKNE